MSLETWKKEFYFVDASDVPVEQAVEHSLRKWSGLRSENLEKHGIWIEARRVSDGNDYLEISSESCALCKFYYDLPDDEVFCETCPLYISLGYYACDDSKYAPYGWFVEDGDPEPMIRALSEIYEQD